MTRNGFEDGPFEAWRKDEPLVLNRPERQGATVLVAGPEFGPGSSREHAAWALQNYGSRAVISSRFADIFRGNSLKNGLLTVTLPHETAERLWALIEADPQAQVTVHLEAREVRAAGFTAPFELDENVRWRLLNGLENISITLQQECHFWESLTRLSNATNNPKCSQCHHLGIVGRETRIHCDTRVMRPFGY